MTALIKTIFSFLPALLDKILGKNTERALELKAQKELEELRAFKSGRISPRFLLLYTLAGIFACAAILLLGSIFFPKLLQAPDVSHIREIIDMGAALIP